MHNAARTLEARQNQFGAGGPSACTVIVAEVLFRVIRDGKGSLSVGTLDECVLSVSALSLQALPCESVLV